MPEPSSATQSRTTGVRALLPLWAAVLVAVAAGLILDLAYPSVGWWPLAFVGVGLSLVALIGRSAWGALLVGFIFGITFYLVHIVWLNRYLGVIPWFALAVAATIYVALGSVLIALAYRWMPRAAPGRWAQLVLTPLLIAGLWTLRELVTGSWPYTGFPWARIGMSQSESPLSHLTSWIGVTGLSFLMVAFTAGTIEWLRLRQWSDVRTALLRQHGAARRLCYQVRTSVAAVSEAKELLWYGQGLTAAHMATLRMLMSTNALRRLEVLNISINKFAAEGMQALCAEPGHGSLPRLRFLDLTGNALGSVGAAALAAALCRGALPQLEILKLGRNNIGDQGLAALAPPLRGLPVLEVLDLHSNQIGDEGVELLLANLSEKQLKQLKTLNLAGNLINDAGRAVLIAALHDDGRALPPLGVLRIDKAG